MESCLKHIKKLAIPVACFLLLSLVLWANGRISLTIRTGTLDYFHDINSNEITAAFLLSDSEEGYTFLMQRDTKKLNEVMFSLQIQPKFWQSAVLDSDVIMEIFLRDSTGARLGIRMVNENIVEVDSRVYKIKNIVDLNYIRACFEGAEDISYQSHAS